MISVQLLTTLEKIKQIKSLSICRKLKKLIRNCCALERFAIKLARKKKKYTKKINSFKVSLLYYI